MDLFSRYVFRQVAGNTLLILLTLTAIIWLGVALKQLDLLTGKGQSVVLFLTMTALALPSIMAIIAPIALLLACLHGLDRLSSDSELIIMSAAGAPVWRLAKPLVALSLVVTAGLVLFHFYINPASLRILHAYVNQVRSDLIAQVLQPGNFSAPEDGLTFHIRARDRNGDLLDLMVHDDRPADRAMTYLAKRGRILSTSDGSYLVMLDGQIHRRLDEPDKKSKGEVNIGEFKEYILEMTQFGPKEESVELKPRERYLTELTNVSPDDEYFQRFSGKFRSEIHERFATLLYPLAFVMITLNFLGNPRTMRERRWLAIVFAFGCAIMVRSAGLAATNMVTLHASAVWLVYAIPAAAIVVAGLAAHIRMSPNARFGAGLELSARLQACKNMFRAASGVRIQPQSRPVG